MSHEKWEYLTLYLQANAKDSSTRSFIQQRFNKKPKAHSPESMIPELNQLGEEGWELVHMEPVARVGGKEDLRFDTDHWSHTFFCVFKRRKVIPTSIAQVASTEAASAIRYQPTLIPPELE